MNSCHMDEALYLGEIIYVASREETKNYTP